MKEELDRLRRWYGGHAPTLLGVRRECAVLCPLLEREDGLHLLFEVRSAAVAQAGETCFPGGRMEPGETPEACALRETREELSIPDAEIQLLGGMDVLCNQRGLVLWSVPALITPQGLEAMTPSPAEVADTFTVPLSFFQNTPPQMYRYDLRPQVPEDFPYEAVGIPRSYPWAWGRSEVPVWYYENRVIWGLTARLILGLLSHL